MIRRRVCLFTNFPQIASAALGIQQTQFISQYHAITPVLALGSFPLSVLLFIPGAALREHGSFSALFYHPFLT